ncbi:hypothetical protein DF147_19735, partial [Burkholderia cenocepacia]
ARFCLPEYSFFLFFFFFFSVFGFFFGFFFTAGGQPPGGGRRVPPCRLCSYGRVIRSGCDDATVLLTCRRYPAYPATP